MTLYIVSVTVKSNMILKSTTDMKADNPSNMAIVPNILRYLERGMLRAREATNLVMAVIETKIAKAEQNYKY